MKTAHIASSLLVAAISFGAHAQSPEESRSSADAYPTQAIKLIVPWAPGGTTDVLARVLAQSLTNSLGKSVYVANVPGAGGNIGTQQFVQAKPDGYTLLMASSSTNAANPYLYKKLGFDPLKDFTPIALVARVPSVLAVSASSPIRTFDDLLKSSKVDSNRLTYASAGMGASAHLAGELLKSRSQIEATHIPYKGTGPAIAAVLAGQVDFTFDTGVSTHIQSGSLRPLATASARRIEALPDVPTFDELGVRDMRLDVWFGLAGPAGMPKEVASKINTAVNAAIGSPEIRERLRLLGSGASPTTVEAFSEFWTQEVARYEGIVALTGATID